MSVMTASGSQLSASGPSHKKATPPSNPEQLKNYRKKRKTDKEKPGATGPPRGNGCENDWDHTKAGTTPWSWVSLTDTSTSRHCPVFTKDGIYFFVIVRNSIEIHSRTTGRVVSTLSTQTNDSDFITSALLSPRNDFQLITGSANGYIRIWDFLDAILLQTVNVEQPIHHICAHRNFPDHIFVASSKRNQGSNDGGKEGTGIVLRVSLKPSTASMSLAIQTSSEVTPIGKTRSVVSLAFSPSGSWLVAIGGHKAYVAATSTLKSGFTKFVSPEALTCLTFHPSEDYFATGDDKGNIRLWYCLGDSIGANSVGLEKRAQTTMLHWHAHAVSSIAFSSNGAYLLSGGEEAVLVIWQLQSGKKEFIPRIGASIISVVVSMSDQGEEYLISLVDATFVFVGATSLKISRSFSRIKLESPNNHHPSQLCTPLAVHASTSTIILPSSDPSSLQIYSPSSSMLVGELEVSPSNRVSRRDDVPIQPSRVEIAVTSPSGEWMATVDGREGDEAFRGEIYLKIWRWSPQSASWILNTRIDRPHGLGHVSSISFSPIIRDHLAVQLVTTGDDCNTKVWRIRAMIDPSGKPEETWVACSRLSFREKRPTNASWSSDSSLLCVSCGPHITLYDSSSNALRHVLTSVEGGPIQSAHFVGRSGKYIVSVNAGGITLWDLATQSVRWHHKSLWPIDKISCHPREESFALIHSPSQSSTTSRYITPITLFHSVSSSPVSKYTLPFGILSLAWYTRSLPRSRASDYTLVGVTFDYNVILAGDNVTLTTEEGSTARALMATSAVAPTKTLFQDMFGMSAFTSPFNTSSPPSFATPSDFEHGLTRLFEAPAYLMPAIETLFEPLMGTFLRPRAATPQNEATTKEQEMVDNDIEMEDESDEVLTTNTQKGRTVLQEEMELFVDLFKKTHVAQNRTTSSDTVNGGGSQAKRAYTSIASGITRQASPLTPAKSLGIDASLEPQHQTVKQAQKRRRPSNNA